MDRSLLIKIDEDSRGFPRKATQLMLIFLFAGIIQTVTTTVT